MSNLKERIERSRKAIAECPEWLRKSMVFQGGGDTRAKPEPPQ